MVDRNSCVILFSLTLALLNRRRGQGMGYPGQQGEGGYDPQGPQMTQSGDPQGGPMYGGYGQGGQGWGQQ
jgi:hypothetical protein